MTLSDFVLTFLGNTVIVGAISTALKFSFDRRIAKLQADLKLSGFIKETVFKNSADTIKEATRRLLEFQKVVSVYSMAMPRTDYKEEVREVQKQHFEFQNWFAVESLHLTDELKLDVLTVFHHLDDIAWTQGIALMDAQMEFHNSAHEKRTALMQLQQKTNEILSTYHAKMKSAIGVS